MKSSAVETQPRSLARSARRGSLAIILVATTIVASSARAQEVVEGPYRFASERFFVATATLAPYPEILPDLGFRLAGAIPGLQYYPEAPRAPLALAAFLVERHRPEIYISNFGTCPNTTYCVADRCSNSDDVRYETLTFGFEPGFEPREGPGFDFVVFDTNAWASPVPADYVVEVKPKGGAWTTRRSYPAATTRHFVRRIEFPRSPASGYDLTAIEMDLSVFGLPYGTVYEEIRLLSGCPFTVGPEYDPVMAAGRDWACADVADCVPGECLDARCQGDRCAYSASAPGTPCATGVCDGRGQPSCVECVDDTRCAAPHPHCEPTINRCVECIEDSHCPGGRCDLESNVCVACLDDMDCSADPTEPCRTPMCAEDLSCALGGPQPDGTPCFDHGYCHGERATCVECRQDEHCSAPSPRCAVGSGRCVACLVDTDCPSPNEPCKQAYCGLAWQCQSRRVAGCASDGGVDPDAEAPLSDAGAESDAGGPPPGPPEARGGGCGCRAVAPPASEHSRPSFALIVLGLMAWRSHRQRRR